MVDDGVHGREDRACFGALGDANAEALLDGHRELERVEGVKPEPVPEEGRFVVDVPGGFSLEVQLSYHQLFQLTPNIRNIHDSGWA